MTGEEFLNKVKAIKKITDIHWGVKGDCFDPDEVKVVVVADGEEFSITYPMPIHDQNDSSAFNQFAALSLIVNKLMKQLENDFRVCATDSLADVVNYARGQIKTTEFHD